MVVGAACALWGRCCLERGIWVLRCCSRVPPSQGRSPLLLEQLLPSGWAVSLRWVHAAISLPPSVYAKSLSLLVFTPIAWLVPHRQGLRPSFLLYQEDCGGHTAFSRVANEHAIAHFLFWDREGGGIITGTLCCSLLDLSAFFSSPVLPSLLDRLGDSKDSVREQDQALLLKIMEQAANPQVWQRGRSHPCVCTCMHEVLLKGKQLPPNPYF